MSYSVAMAIVGGLCFWLGLAGLCGLMLRWRRMTTTYAVKGARRDTH